MAHQVNQVCPCFRKEYCLMAPHKTWLLLYNWACLLNSKGGILRWMQRSLYDSNTVIQTSHQPWATYAGCERKRLLACIHKIAWACVPLFAVVVVWVVALTAYLFLSLSLNVSDLLLSEISRTGVQIQHAAIHIGILRLHSSPDVQQLQSDKRRRLWALYARSQQETVM